MQRRRRAFIAKTQKRKDTGTESSACASKKNLEWRNSVLEKALSQKGEAMRQADLAAAGGWS